MGQRVMIATDGGDSVFDRLGAPAAAETLMQG
jgi:hypothetical protein